MSKDRLDTCGDPPADFGTGVELPDGWLEQICTQVQTEVAMWPEQFRDKRLMDRDKIMEMQLIETERAKAASRRMEISPENFWREVWHVNCPKTRCGIMKRHNEYLTIEDGSELRLFECLHCGQKAFAGLDARRFVTVREVAEVQP